eukprot:CAMPEP_0206421844 /NCGR_PEP_ID=MMETSP0324_2-20121206/1695_1 /ASSEMBLY_ACC=CAM_ASM_000836 /TAXON_ID=2866 /ORGANISM="Crypthecodinium cohnii, Strain Seligo" /LENGTH=100 /DNA_ID=CAMNT_0053886027 /DNA_START=97 /DNA_END=398 /DNA_ORIENTATION=+
MTHHLFMDLSPYLAYSEKSFLVSILPVADALGDSFAQPSSWVLHTNADFTEQADGSLLTWNRASATIANPVSALSKPPQSGSSRSSSFYDLQEADGPMGL